MRGDRRLSVAAVAAVLAAAGCSAPRHDDASAPAATTAPAAVTAPAITTAPQAHRHAPAPKDPDLGTVMERFYQQVEGDHWRFAYAMLSPRYRATHSQANLQNRYSGLVGPNVTLRQLSDTTVVTHIDAHSRSEPTRALHVEETVTLVWDGEQWTIDDITSRSVSDPGTR